MSCHACLGKYAPEAQPLLAAKKEEAAGRSPARIFKDYVHNAALMAIPAALVLVVTACVCLGLGYDLPKITGGLEPGLEFPEPLVVNPPGNARAEAAVVFLHGLGGHARGVDGVGIAANLIRLPGVKWIFPDAPVMPVTVEGGRNIPSWYDIERFTDSIEDFVDDKTRIIQSAQFVTGIVQELVAKDGIAPEKIVLGGFSQGGAVALTAALHGASALGPGVSLGGVFALSSYLPMRDVYPSPMMPDPSVAARTKVLIAHGDEDAILPLEFGQVTAQKLSAMGANVEFHEMYGVGHERLGDEETAILRRWLAQLV